jgi:HlyD family secretion protein
VFKNKKIIIIFAIIVAVAGWFAWTKYAKADDVQKYKTVTLANGDVTQSASANGTLNPVTLVSVGTQVSGTVMQLKADYNDKVKAGQILAILDPSLLDAQITSSKASVESAKSSLDLAVANQKRAQELFKSEYISKQDLDIAEQALKAAKASYIQAKAQLSRDTTNLSYSVIKSPVSGIVIDRQIDVGQTVAASFQTPTLFKIAKDLSKMQIDSSFAEADVGQIKVGQKVKFSVDAFGSRVFDGVVSQIRLNAQNVQNVVTYDVVISVQNPDEILFPSMTAYVNVIIAERENVLLVPNAALRYKPKDFKKENHRKTTGDANQTVKKDISKSNEQKRATVFVLKDGKPEAVRIKIGITDNKFTEILSDNLKVGDQIITDEVEQGGGKGRSGSMMKMF